MAAQCTAMTKKNKQCKNKAKPGSACCARHGGVTPAVKPIRGQCSAITKKNKQCKNKAKPGSTCCGRHQPAPEVTPVQKPVVEKVDEREEEIEVGGLYEQLCVLELHNEDCFGAFKKVKGKTVDLFLLDLPYGQTACKWDSIIDLTEMWKEIKRTMKKEAVIVFFCTTKFGYKLIQSNEKWFRYDLVWKKSRKVGFLSANKRPMRQDEMNTYKDKYWNCKKPLSNLYCNGFPITC
jgi:hypothetical protein